MTHLIAASPTNPDRLIAVRNSVTLGVIQKTTGGWVVDQALPPVDPPTDPFDTTDAALEALEKAVADHDQAAQTPGLTKHEKMVLDVERAYWAVSDPVRRVAATRRALRDAYTPAAYHEIRVALVANPAAVAAAPALIAHIRLGLARETPMPSSHVSAAS